MVPAERAPEEQQGGGNRLSQLPRVGIPDACPSGLLRKLPSVPGTDQLSVSGA